MKITITIPERIKERFLNEILEMYTRGEVSAGKAAEMLGIPAQPSMNYQQKREYYYLKN